jgi:hypothetical protein
MPPGWRPWPSKLLTAARADNKHYRNPLSATFKMSFNLVVPIANARKRSWRTFLHLPSAGGSAPVLTSEQRALAERLGAGNKAKPLEQWVKGQYTGSRDRSS